jgi:hypothetical protein
MTDRPVIGQIGRVTGAEQLKIEIIGELKRKEWEEFRACLEQCCKRFPNLTVREQRYSVKVKSVGEDDKKP